MKLKILAYPIVALLLASGCKREKKIQPEELSTGYVLPQGNHPYDNTIVNFYQTYKTYILYKFSVADFRWNVASNIPYEAEQGDESYIEPSLAALDKYLFKFYSEAFLKKALPYKILLSSRIRSYDNKGVLLDDVVNSASTSSHFAFGRAGSSLASMSTQELLLMKTDLHREFWKQAVSFDKVSIPPAFVAATNYNSVTNGNKKNFGVFIVQASRARQLR